MKALIVIMVFFSCLCKSQSPGLTNGLAVDLNFDQRTNDLRKNSAEASQIRANQYNYLTGKYNDAVKWNNAQDEPKIAKQHCYCAAIIVFGDNFIKKADVLIKDYKAISANTGESKIEFNQSTTLNNFKCMGKTSNGGIVEIILMDIFN